MIKHIYNPLNLTDSELKYGVSTSPSVIIGEGDGMPISLELTLISIHNITVMMLTLLEKENINSQEIKDMAQQIACLVERQYWLISQINQ